MIFKDSSSLEVEANKDNYTLSKLYKRGIFMNVTNPKVSIFFLAFLPQFSDASKGSVTLQIFILGAIFMLCAFLVFSLISLLASKIGAWFNQNPKANIILNRIAGSIFVALALKLAFTQISEI